MRHPLVASLVGPALLAAALVGGCADTIPEPTTVATAGMPNPEAALRQSMRRVDAEMVELGAMKARPDEQAGAGTPPLPDDLRRIVNFAWAGSLDKGVARLALSIGYTFYTTAPPDAPPLAVTVHIQGAPAFDVFKALGDAAGASATVLVDPLHHQVQVIHHA